MRRSPSSTKKMYNHIKIDNKTFRLLKKYCKKQGMTLQAAATFAVIKYLEEQ